MEKIDWLIIIITLIIFTIILGIQQDENNDYIKQLKQNNTEQAEEKEVYINKCKMYEDFMIKSGIIDECECR